MLNIHIILGSTRPNRQGEKVARWVYEGARKQIDWVPELIDLRDWPLPMFDLPFSPASKGKELPELVATWTKKVAAADGYIFVTPEYNHGYPAVLKNAMDYVFYEWGRKPAAFVGYSSGPIAGARSVQQLRAVANELDMAPIRQDILIPIVTQAFDDDGNIKDQNFEKKLGGFFSQITWWAETLKHGREQQAQVGH